MFNLDKCKINTVFKKKLISKLCKFFVNLKLLSFNSAIKFIISLIFQLSLCN
jgi:hypothetical protein